MDPSLLGTAGVAGVLVVVIGYLLKQNHADRKQYQDHIAEVQTSTAAEVARLNAKVDALNALYESERRARWAAEDKAAEYKRLYEATAPGGTT